jgi:class 3 adenylate cyclase
VKIGINAGEPIAEEDDLYGTAVQIAARVTDQAAAGEIVVTNVVRELVAGKGYLFAEREPAALKGVEEPVRLFTLGVGDG